MKRQCVSAQFSLVEVEVEIDRFDQHTFFFFFSPNYLFRLPVVVSPPPKYSPLFCKHAVYGTVDLLTSQSLQIFISGILWILGPYTLK